MQILAICILPCGKEHFKPFSTIWNPIDKTTALSDQESPTVHKSMLCNMIHSNPGFLQIEHLNELGQAQGTSEITYHNYLTLLHTTAFQLNLKQLNI